MEVKNYYYSELSKYKINDEIIYTIINRISKSDSFDKYIEYKKYGNIMLTTLFNINKKYFIENIKIKPKNNSYLLSDTNGNIKIYGINFKKIV